MALTEQYVLVKALVPTPVDPDAHPEHPIYIPVQPPDGIWGGANEPFPTPPIYIPVVPPGIWGGANEPMPTPPIYIPVFDPDAHPEHPIYIPIDPPEIWGGANEPFPTPPINLPPFALDEEQKQRLKEFLTGNLPPFDPPDYVAPIKK